MTGTAAEVKSEIGQKQLPNVNFQKIKNYGFMRNMIQYEDMKTSIPHGLSHN